MDKMSMEISTKATFGGKEMMQASVDSELHRSGRCDGAFAGWNAGNGVSE